MNETKEFLRRVLPPAGDWYCWCTPAPASAAPRRYDQRFTKYAAHIADGVHQCDGHQLNTYYAMASFKERGSRKQDNVAFLKSFWIDVDCGEAKAAEGKGYATKKDGVRALHDTVVGAGLPMPMVVDSGNGIHAYWPLAEAVEADVWRPVAARIVAALQQEGLIADWGCSTDHSRILRPVGTHNWKDKANPKPVRLVRTCPDYTLEEIAGPVAHIVAAVPASRSNDLGVNSDLGMPPEPPSSLPDVVAERCAQVREFKDTNGCLPEPQWRAGLSILKSCIDGEETAHLWSSGYPLYQFAETQEKLDQIKGPYTCATYERYNPAGCAGCVHKGKITSPIQLGRPEPEEIEDDAVEEVADESTGVVVERPVQRIGDDTLTIYPSAMKPFAWNGNEVVIRKKADDGHIEEVPITTAYIYCHDMLEVKGQGWSLRFTIRKRAGRVTFVADIPCSAIASPDGIKKALYNHGVTALLGREKEFEMLIKKWFEYAQKHANESLQHLHFGWQRDGGFLIGNRLFKHKKAVQQVSLGGPAEILAPLLNKQGDLSEWTRLINEAYGGAGQEQYQFIIACGFGAPLMRMTAVDGVTVDMVSSESGVGKTTVARAALSIWGAPEDMSQTYGIGATEVAIFTRIATMNSIPCYLDEITKAPADFLGRLSYAVTSGKPRDRGRQNGLPQELQEGWSTIMLASGNTSMQSKIGQARGAAEAEMGRVLEFRMDPSKLDSEVSDARERFMELSRHYGLAGEVYTQYLVDNIDTIQRDLDALTRRIDKRCGITQMERFWSASVAAAIMGVTIAVRLGLVNFDVKSLLDWSVSRIVESRNAVASSTRTESDDFGSMLLSLTGTIAVTDTRNPPRENESLFLVGGRLPNRLNGRMIKDEQLLWLSITAAKNWCAENNADYGAIVKAAKQRGEVLREEVFNLGLNIDAPQAPVRCLVIQQDEGSAPQDG